MEKRNIQIDINTARKWYNGNNEALKDLALQAFNMNELEETKLPKSWEEFGKNGYLSSRYFKYTNQIDILEKLLILRDVYRQGWKPDWECTQRKKWIILFINDSIIINFNYDISHLFSFPTKELANLFLENFRDELEQLKELL